MDAGAWDQRYADADLVWSARPNVFVETELNGLPPGRALDLAAGEGRNALWLAARGWHVTAVDFSRAGLDKGRRLQERHERGRDLAIDWVQADVLDYAPEPGSFDLVVIAYLQLPRQQRRTAVHHGFQALGEGGTFLLVAHDSSNLSEGTGGPQDPEVLMTAEDVLADLDGERFEVVRAERVAREVLTAGEHDAHGGEHARTAYDALVHLERSALL